MATTRYRAEAEPVLDAFSADCADTTTDARLWPPESGRTPRSLAACPSRAALTLVG
ncbi:hypothetical protein [Allokutzneria albata]|uniref:Uncharacterized protein n=1 Tax=Allokutzneria albata TaxID=211114 RepID=A0A1H0D1P1_ALLAB|nr:hypothetical protein [Allokutzneria albata]SDN64065.1 hypothetical protein SAMN04489726_7540 [Allokutzneria albata]